MADPLPAILSHPLFDGSDQLAVQALANHVQTLRLRKGALLGGAFSGPRIYLVLSGALHPFIITGDGRRLILEVVAAGSYDGLLAARGHEGHLCQAACSSLVAGMRLTELDRCIDVDPTIGRNLLDLTLARLANREAHMAGMAHRDALHQLAHQLLAVGRYAGSQAGDWIELTPRPTHQALAEMIGTRRETVSLQLGILRRLGAIEVLPATLRLHPERLRQMQQASVLSLGRKKVVSQAS